MNKQQNYSSTTSLHITSNRHCLVETIKGFNKQQWLHRICFTMTVMANSLTNPKKIWHPTQSPLATILMTKLLNLLVSLSMPKQWSKMKKLITDLGKIYPQAMKAIISLSNLLCWVRIWFIMDIMETSSISIIWDILVILLKKQPTQFPMGPSMNKLLLIKSLIRRRRINLSLTATSKNRNYFMLLRVHRMLKLWFLVFLTISLLNPHRLMRISVIVLEP